MVVPLVAQSPLVKAWGLRMDSVLFCSRTPLPKFLQQERKFVAEIPMTVVERPKDMVMVNSTFSDMWQKKKAKDMHNSRGTC